MSSRDQSKHTSDIHRMRDKRPEIMNNELMILQCNLNKNQSIMNSTLNDPHHKEIYNPSSPGTTLVTIHEIITNTSFMDTHRTNNNHIQPTLISHIHQ